MKEYYISKHGIHAYSGPSNLNSTRATWGKTQLCIPLSSIKEKVNELLSSSFLKDAFLPFYTYL